jgi:hypothetical protein
MRAGYYYIERGKRTENDRKRTENDRKRTENDRKRTENDRKRTENDRKQLCLRHKQPIKVKILISFGKSFGRTEKY